MAELLFYDKPALLNREIHKTLRFKVSSDYHFTEKVNSVPLTGVEFFEASRDMPVLFSKSEEGDYYPLALLSLMDGAHKQLGQSGVWEDSYIPAFVRRYPFALNDEGSVCFDEEASQFSSADGEPLFTDKGENSETLNSIIQFLGNYDQQNQSTREYCDACKKLDLFMPLNVEIRLENDKPLRLEGLYALDEKKLAEIPEDKVQGWFKAGWLAWSYAHLHSLGALKRLIKRQASK